MGGALMIFDILLNSLFCFFVLSITVLPYWFDKKVNKLLINNYLKNEKIVNLLRSSKYSDFIVPVRGVTRLNNSNHVRLLKEYIADDKQIKRYGLKALSFYYSNPAYKMDDESYDKFKHNMENK